MNKVILIGNLTRDPEFKFIPSGDAVADFGIAINEGTKEKPITTFVDITAWRKTAELVNQYINKGSKVAIDGSLSLDQWEDAQTGQKRSRLKVTAYKVEFLDTKERVQNTPQQSDYNQAPPAPQQPQMPQAPQQPPF